MKLRSITGKVLAWSVCILIVSSVASWWIAATILFDAYDVAFAHSDAFELHQAIAAYEHGGRDELRGYLADLHRFEGSERYFTDSAGRDLLTGEDRSALLAGAGDSPRSFIRVNRTKYAVRVPSPDGRYRYVVLFPSAHHLPLFAPYFVLLLVVVAMLFWVLSVQIARPLRRLAGAVRRFGAGELNVRVGGQRRDEIGDVERSFDNMADRIQTLLTAERQLLQDVSHELRSPLARLRLAAEVVGSASDPQAAALRLRGETERLTGLVNSLLQMTTVEGDPEAFEVDDVNVSNVLRGVVIDCELEAEERGCTLQVEAPEDARALGDGELLHRAIENIVRNAIRYAPEGSTIETRLVEEEGRIVLTVRDCGPGVPEDELPKIFNPFFRVDDSRDASSGGIGLGLAIARRAIRLHNGQVSAANANPGLLVTITLPALDERL